MFSRRAAPTLPSAISNEKSTTLSPLSNQQPATSNSSAAALAVGWLWYLGMLVPMIGIVQAGAQAHADRYTYLSQIGLVIFVVWMLERIFVSKRVRQSLISAFVLAVLLVCMRGAHLQTSYWRNSLSLVTRALECTERNFVMHNTFGSEMVNQKRFEEAIPHYLRALQINPNFYQAQYNLGNAYTSLGLQEKAAVYYEKALRLNPTLFMAHYNIGAYLASQDRLDESRSRFLEAVRIRPDFALAYLQLGSLSLSQQDVQEAVAYYEKTIELQADHWDACRRLAWIFSASADEEMRDGVRALALARQANELTGEKNWVVLETLAASHAENQSYTDAVHFQACALECAQDDVNPELLLRMKSRLELYRDNKPLRGQPWLTLEFL